MRTLIVIACMLAFSTTAQAQWELRQRPGVGRWELNDEYGNTIGDVRRSPAGRYRVDTYGYPLPYRQRYQPREYNYYYTTPYRSANPGLYYQYDAYGNYRWEYRW